MTSQHASAHAAPTGDIPPGAFFVPAGTVVRCPNFLSGGGACLKGHGIAGIGGVYVWRNASRTCEGSHCLRCPRCGHQLAIRAAQGARA